MTALQDFLIENETSNITAEIQVSDRIPYKFKIRPMKPKERTLWRKQCQSAIKGKTGEMSFDGGKFAELSAINCTVEPNFRSTDFMEKAGVPTPQDLLNKVLLSGEIDELHEQICKLSGYGSDGTNDVTDEDLEEAKN